MRHITNFIILLALLLSGTHSLTCNFGTASSLALAPANCTVSAGQDACISAVFNTTLNGNTTGNSVYTCGNCSFYQSSTSFAASVTCCATDNCQTIDPPPATGTCASLTDSASCTTRDDCFWCNNSVFGMGICQDLPGGTINDCWAVPLRAPPSVCASIQCAPPPQPYTVQSLTLAYQAHYGFKPVMSLGTNAAIGFALNAQSRFAQTRVLNDTYAFCDVDQELKQWCGHNTTSKFAFCILAEDWPQPDVWGWIQNSSLTATGLVPIYPAFCACANPGRAYYLPVRQIDNKPHYAPPCSVENGMLAVYILLMVCSCVVFIFVLYDTVIGVISAIQRKKLATMWQTLVVKIFIILYFLVTIPNQAEFAAPSGQLPVLATTKSVMRFLGVIFLLLSFTLAVFAFLEILLKAKLVGKKTQITGVQVFKWGLLLISSFLLFGALGMTGGFSYYILFSLQFRAENITQITYAATVSTGLAKAIMLTLLCTQALLLIFTAIVLLIVNLYLARIPRQVKGMSDLLGRNAGLCVAWFIGLPNLAILAIITPVVAWITTGTIPSYWNSTYETNMVYTWMLWVDFVTELLWISAIAFSMRTTVGKGWMQSQFNTCCGFRHLESMSSPSDHSGSTGTGNASMDVSGQDVDNL